jgi:hypothetical protein
MTAKVVITNSGKIIHEGNSGMKSIGVYCSFSLRKENHQLLVSQTLNCLVPVVNLFVIVKCWICWVVINYVQGKAVFLNKLIE